MTRRFRHLALATLTLLPVSGLAQDSPEMAPMDAGRFVLVALECPAYGTGELVQTWQNRNGEKRSNVITYKGFLPASVTFSAVNAQGDIALTQDSDIPSGDRQAALDLAEPVFNRVCNYEFGGFDLRYREFLRRNRSDLEAPSGTPLHNETDPTTLLSPG